MALTSQGCPPRIFMSEILPQEVIWGITRTNHVFSSRNNFSSAHLHWNISSYSICHRAIGHIVCTLVSSGFPGSCASGPFTTDFLENFTSYLPRLPAIFSEHFQAEDIADQDIDFHLHYLFFIILLFI